MLFISSVFASSRSNIPHTPLELRERPAARQGAGSGMSLLSQRERLEGSGEHEVRPDGPGVVRLLLSGPLDLPSSNLWSAPTAQSTEHCVATEVRALGPIITHRNLILELLLFKSMSPLLSVAVSCRLTHGLHRCHTRLAPLSVHSVRCWGSPSIQPHGQTHWLAARACGGTRTAASLWVNRSRSQTVCRRRHACVVSES